jgi:hypothetical protein
MLIEHKKQTERKNLKHKTSSALFSFLLYTEAMKFFLYDKQTKQEKREGKPFSFSILYHFHWREIAASWWCS